MFLRSQWWLLPVTGGRGQGHVPALTQHTWNALLNTGYTRSGSPPSLSPQLGFLGRPSVPVGKTLPIYPRSISEETRENTLEIGKGPTR